MFTRMSVELPTPVLVRLAEYLAKQGGTQDMSEAITQALDCWLAENEAGPAEHSAPLGYHWKCLFLPEGTLLTCGTYGQQDYARVENGRIMFQGRSLSPNQFARLRARSNRNAWEDLTIRRPGDKYFKQARILRSELLQQSAPPRLPPALAAQPPAEQASTAAPAPYIDPERLVSSFGDAPMPPLAPRDTTPGPGWTLPERRRYRYRIEDVAYE